MDHRARDQLAVSPTHTETHGKQRDNGSRTTTTAAADLASGLTYSWCSAQLSLALVILAVAAHVGFVTELLHDNDHREVVVSIQFKYTNQPTPQKQQQHHEKQPPNAVSTTK